MKTLINSLTNTYKALRLLSNPHISAYIETEVKKLQTATQKPFNSSGLGLKDAIYHKHYIVHIVN